MYVTGQAQTRIVFPSPAKLFTPGVTTILILLIVGILLSTFAHSFTIDILALNPQSVLHGKIWQLVTYPFVNCSPMGLIFSGLMMLMLGSAIERQWRTASFLLLWLIISSVCGLLWVIVNLLTRNNFIGMGASGCTYGLIATIGLLYRDRRFFMFVSVDARTMVLILLVIGVLVNIAMPINMIWLLGALVAYVYIKLSWAMAAKSSGHVSSKQQRRATGFIDID